MSLPKFHTPRKVVIDTDVGSDDAIALILCAAAEQKSEIEILGITCVQGNTSVDNVCANTLKTLKTIDKMYIPVYRGAEESLVETLHRAEDIHGSDGFGDFEYPDPPNPSEHVEKEHAVNFLNRIARRYPLEVSVLCLGPLTNIALARRMNEEFSVLINEIMIMGGNSEGIGNVTAGAEFNFACDPHAAYVVLHDVKCRLTVFPFEAAYKYGHIPYEWRLNVLGALDTPQTELINKVERPMLSTKRYGVWARCDPLAAAIFLNKKVATKKKLCYATVEIHGQAAKGAMVVDHLEKMKQRPNITLIERVDVELYKEMLINAFSMYLYAKPHISTVLL